MILSVETIVHKSHDFFEEMKELMALKTTNTVTTDTISTTTADSNSEDLLEGAGGAKRLTALEDECYQLLNTNARLALQMQQLGLDLQRVYKRFKALEGVGGKKGKSAASAANASMSRNNNNNKNRMPFNSTADTPVVLHGGGGESDSGSEVNQQQRSSSQRQSQHHQSNNSVARHAEMKLNELSGRISVITDQLLEAPRAKHYASDELYGAPTVFVSPRHHHHHRSLYERTPVSQASPSRRSGAVDPEYHTAIAKLGSIGSDLAATSRRLRRDY
jgi:hypothetical protein